MRATRWTIRRRLFDRFAPRLTPGDHRYCAVLDAPRLSCITDPAGFDRMAANMFPEGVTK